MTDQRPKLADFSQNIYSQFGEDGILKKIFETIGAKNKICVEFGAWEGYLHSNTANLWTHGWKGILIEGDASKFDKLVENTKDYGCVCINAFVQPSGAYSIDAILARNEISQVDLMSIDIDGNDYYILESIEKVLPRIIVCEFNPTIPKHLELVAAKNNFFGCSSLALINLAKRKGYCLIAMTDTNCIFVKEEEYAAFSGYCTDHTSLAPEQNLTYLITGYDGTYALSKEPAYGYTRPFAGKLAVGSVWRIKQEGFGKKLLKKIYYSPVAESLRMAFSVIAWHVGGKKTPPPQYIKAKTILAQAKRHRITTLVETGTYLGQTIWSLKTKFKEIHSIEISDKLFNRAKKKFQKFDHIQLHLGDSATVLPEIVSRLRTPTLFWLDGHYSGGITEKGALETPIMQELETILTGPIKNHVILIDDARCFVGKNDYPTVDELKAKIAHLKPNAEIQIQNDMILIADKI